MDEFSNVKSQLQTNNYKMAALNDLEMKVDVMKHNMKLKLDVSNFEELKVKMSKYAQKKDIIHLKEELNKKADLEDLNKINESLVQNDEKIKELENYAKFISSGVDRCEAKIIKFNKELISLR